jgi:iron complex transport system ATP-binding protein
MSSQANSLERGPALSPAPAADAADGAVPVLELTDVTFRRGASEIIRGVSLTVRAGEHWAMLGPNGAGKSTLLGFCGAVTHPTSGTVRVLGQQLGRVELQALRRSIGHVNPRHPLRSPLPARDIVLTGLTGTIETAPRWRPTDAEAGRADALISQLGLAAKAAQRWNVLSQGERGRVLIARALIGQPEVLLLDEPSTGLDIAAREQLLEAVDLLAETHPEVASVLVTHHLEELPSSTTHALLLAGGQVVAAGPARDAITSAHVSAAFDHPIDVWYHDGRWAARAARRAPLAT